MVLDASLLNTQHYKVWSNSGKGVMLSPTPQCSSYWKWSLCIALNYGQPTHLFKEYWLQIAVEPNINNICMEEHKYSHSELELKYNDTTNGGIFVSTSACKNSVNAAIGGVGILLSSCAFRSLNSIVRTHPRIMCATFNGNLSTTIVSCYSPTNASDEIDITTFYNRLSSSVRHIPKHNILIMGGDINTQIGKDRNHRFCLHNLPNRNGKYLADFSLVNSLACLNTKFQKREGKL